jgi:Ser/Thr protein kinase RdoA (MazF antagonist)
MPRPVQPGTAAIGLWAPVDVGSYVRVSEWVDGVPPAPADAGVLADWLGGALATIDGLRLPGDPTVEAAYPIHDVLEWRDWFDEAVGAEVLDRGQLPRLSTAVREATAVIRSALATGPVFQLAHRDVSRRNILMTRDGPLLLDFDYAGPEVSWWEFVHHVFDLASAELGRHPPVPGPIRSALTAYTAAGAVPGPARPEAFAGMLRAILNSLAYNLWVAVGHRPGGCRPPQDRRPGHP